MMKMISSQYTAPLNIQLWLKLVQFLAKEITRLWCLQNQPLAWVYRIQSRQRRRTKIRYLLSTDMTIEFRHCQIKNANTCKSSMAVLQKVRKLFIFDKAWFPRISIMLLATLRKVAQNQKCLTAPNRRIAHLDHAKFSHQSFSMRTILIWKLTALFCPTIILEIGHRSIHLRLVTRLLSPNKLAFK